MNHKLRGKSFYFFSNASRKRAIYRRFEIDSIPNILIRSLQVKASLSPPSGISPAAAAAASYGSAYAHPSYYSGVGVDLSNFGYHAANHHHSHQYSNHYIGSNGSSMLRPSGLTPTVADYESYNAAAAAERYQAL